ncbi:XRE family transcriptional regulator [Coriobacteriales bacterium OH1046]|nr:XRE family transcriptional regulator [Coriobacteriales bacterium OH1046]
MVEITIKEARVQAGLSQQDVAAKLGVSRQAYANMEQNPGSVKVDTARRICSILGTEYERIFFSSFAN